MEFKTNTLYTINLNLNTCTVTNLTQPWQNHTIPTDATLEDEYELGAPGSGFRVREWSDRLPARRGIRLIISKGNTRTTSSISQLIMIMVSFIESPPPLLLPSNM